MSSLSYAHRLASVGQALYPPSDLKVYRRYFIFRARCLMHASQVKDLLQFFDASEARARWLDGCPSLMEQTTRAFFYKGSTWAERTTIVKRHVEMLEARCLSSLMDTIYAKRQGIRLWEDIHEGHPLTLHLLFHKGQRKEGCLSLVMTYKGAALYQIMFWLDVDSEGCKAVYVGALQ